MNKQSDTTKRNKLVKNLTQQAAAQTLTLAGQGIYNFLPNDAGEFARRFNELCTANGLDPQTGEFNA